MISQSDPEETRFIFCCTIMSFNWERTSRTCINRIEKKNQIIDATLKKKYIWNLDNTLEKETWLHKRSSHEWTLWARGVWAKLWESDLAHGLGMDKVVIAPDAGVIVVLPLHVDIKVGEVVALRDWELLPHLITFLLAALQTHTGKISVSHSSLFYDRLRSKLWYSVIYINLLKVPKTYIWM